VVLLAKESCFCSNENSHGEGKKKRYLNPMTYLDNLSRNSQGGHLNNNLYAQWVGIIEQIIWQIGNGVFFL
jgi:hypothetical protein